MTSLNCVNLQNLVPTPPNTKHETNLGQKETHTNLGVAREIGSEGERGAGGRQLKPPRAVRHRGLRQRHPRQRLQNQRQKGAGHFLSQVVLSILPEVLRM
jgi:hypothetical protein